MERALPRAAGDPALRRARGRPVRAVAGHFAEHPRRLGGLGRGCRPLAGRDRRRRGISRQLLHHGDRLPVGGEPAGFRGARRVRRAGVPHRALAARGGRFRRPAGGRRRHRLLGGAGDPGDRQAGGASHRVPAHGELCRPGQQPEAGGRRAGRDQGALSRAPRHRQEDVRRVHGGDPPGIGARGVRGRMPRDAGAGLGTGRDRLPQQLSRFRLRRGGEPAGAGVRAPEDPRDRQGTPGPRRSSCPGT